MVNRDRNYIQKKMDLSIVNIHPYLPKNRWLSLIKIKKNKTPLFIPTISVISTKWSLISFLICVISDYKLRLICPDNRQIQPECCSLAHDAFKTYFA